MKYIKITISFIVLFVLSNACEKDFLERSPLDSISEDAFFKHTNDLQLYINRFYNGGLFRRTNDYARPDLNSDNQVSERDIDDRLAGTRVVPASGGGWDYVWVRRINYFFDNYRKCEDDFEDYKQLVGEAHFFRALIFSQLVEKFGDVVWYNHVLKEDAPEIMSPRMPRNEVIDKVLADLDSAAMYLTPDRYDDGKKINKWTALALQSKIALTEGTWEKYHTGGPFAVSNANPDKYLNKAVEAAQVVMNDGNFTLYSTGNPESDYWRLFILRDFSSTSEVLFWKQYSKELEITNFRQVGLQYPYGYGVTKSFADSYLCTDGDPISVSPLFAGYDTIADEMQNRDPRFSQTIFTPDAPWQIQSNDTNTFNVLYVNLFTEDKNSSGTGYSQRKHYNPDLETLDLAGEEEPWIIYRFAEVLLNFAEAKAELGSITQSDLDISVNLLRERVGMPHLLLGSITTDPDWDFPALSPIINEIRRERRVEMSVEQLRWFDIARWAAADELIVGKRPIGMKVSENYFGTIIQLPVNAEGFVDVFQLALPDGYQFIINRDYLDPIPSDQLTLNPNLGQNPGW